MRELPQAQLLVHPRGARHMIDPTALWQGATAVYGAQAMASAYGSVVPVPEARVRTTHDGMALDLAGRVLSFADTPGHARHHHCIWDETSGGWFTGDSFGISYRELDTAQGAWMLPSATPVQFDPPALRTTIERLLARAPQRMYLTHYGCVDEVQRLGGQLLSLLQEMVLLGQAVRRSPARHEALERGQLDLFARSLAAHGCDWDREQIGQFLAIDLKLNAQGMAVWLDREG
jgi:glyoxylase-like metal-dependent hydrolase (beta-lactamase superfamily II)